MIYAVYTKNDELEFVGEDEEVSKYLKIELNELHSILSRRKRRGKVSDSRKVYRIKEED